jgi:hypothetical protein
VHGGVGRCVSINPDRHNSSKYTRCTDCQGVDEGPKFPSRRSHSPSETVYETYCQIQSIVPGSEINSKKGETGFPDDNLCIDISGQNTNIGGFMIG